MPRQPANDISESDFKHQLKLHSLAWMPAARRFIDLKHASAGRHILPVMDESGRRLLREASIRSCLAARAAYEAELAEAARAEEAKLRLAEKIAPSALPPCRADLDGPAAVAQLADDFIVQTTHGEGVVFGELIRLGWTGPQLKQHADAARIVAQRRQDRQTLKQPERSFGVANSANMAEEALADRQLRAVAAAMAEPGYGG